MESKTVLAGLSLDELKKLLETYPSYRSVQIYERICSGAKDFDEISSLPLRLRKELKDKYQLLAGKISGEQKSTDSTVKIAITLEDGITIESVLLVDDKDRKTACLSTQAGCGIGCVFCKTGSMGLKRNLNYREIISQFLYLIKEKEKPSHIVIMGMGEPLMNIGELRKALNFFMKKDTLNISKRRITLSTSGIAEGIEDFTNNGPDIGLAFSLLTARQELRDKLIPVSKKNPLPLLKEKLINYQKIRKHRITLEMVLLKNINTTKEDIIAASDFAADLDVVFNIIPWNKVEGLSFEGMELKTPAIQEVNEYCNTLLNMGFNVTKRHKKGNEIQGACGQLALVT